MLSKRFQIRPLGQMAQESRLELQVEKALFKTNMKLLSDMITMGKRPKHLQTTVSQESNPHRRLFLTRSERLRKFNDAEYQSKFTTEIQEKVVPLDQVSQSFQPFCERHYRKETGKLRHAHCDVLGPHYCTDCIKLRRRKNSAKTHQSNFPNVEVHPRSLVAPDKVDRVLISREKVMFNGRLTPLDTYEQPVGYNERIYLPVLTENEVHQRLRNSFRDKSVSSSPRSPKSPSSSYRESMFREISAVHQSNIPTTQMQVSVTFSTPND